MSNITFKTSLFLDKGLLSSADLPDVADALPLTTEKFAASNLTYTAQVDRLYKTQGVESTLNDWTQPLAGKPELYEPTRFTETLVSIKSSIKDWMAKDNAQDSRIWRELSANLGTDVDNRHLAELSKMALYEG
jgi:hypothetical protein